MPDYHVDPSIGANSGAGTVGDPWGSTGNEIQRAMDLIGAGPGAGALGDTIHIRDAGTVSFGGTNLDFTAYGLPTIESFLGFSGYAGAAYDGGRATIDLGGASSFVPNVTDHLYFGDLNVSGGTLSFGQIRADNSIVFFRVDAAGGGSRPGLWADSWAVFINNHTHDTGASNGILVSSGVAYSNFTEVSGNGVGISSGGGNSTIINNLVTVSGTGSATGIQLGNNAVSAIGNTVVSSGACTGRGIRSTINAEGVCILNNYIEGFSGVGAEGIWVDSGSSAMVIAGNRFFNNMDNIVIDGVNLVLENNVDLPSSGLVDITGENYIPTAALKGVGFPAGFLNLAGNPLAITAGAIQSASGGIYNPFETQVIR